MIGLVLAVAFFVALHRIVAGTSLWRSLVRLSGEGRLPDAVHELAAKILFGGQPVVSPTASREIGGIWLATEGMGEFVVQLENRDSRHRCRESSR